MILKSDLPPSKPRTLRGAGWAMRRGGVLTEPLVSASAFEDTETTHVIYCSESLTEMSSL